MEIYAAYGLFFGCKSGEIFLFRMRIKKLRIDLMRLCEHRIYRRIERHIAFNQIMIILAVCR